jgi:hypothetical protein
VRNAFRSPFFLALGASLLVAYPAFCLTCDFQIDWTNHKWLIAYYGEFFREHLGFPVFLHTRRAAGMAYPVFYGVFFYPLLGALSAFLNVDLLLRGAAFLLLAWQVLRVRAVALRLKWGSWHATALGSLVIWAIYPVTNLFFRSALTEFFAYGLLVGAFTYLWEAWLVTVQADRRRYLARAALSFTACAGTHPITAVLGSLALALVSILFLLRRPPTRRALAQSAGFALLALIALGPWLWATASYGRRVEVGREARTLTYYRASIDSPLDRLLPFGFDRRMVESQHVQTPFLCAQVSLPLIALWVLLGARARERGKARGRELAATVLLTAAFGLVFWLSVGSDLGGLFGFVQFAYRFVNYLNLLALAGVLWYSYRAGPLRAPVLMTMLVVWAAATGATHASRAGRIARDVPRWSAPADLGRLPASFYGASAYAVPDEYPEELDASAPRVRLPVGRGRAFGILGSKAVVGQVPLRVCTQVLVFPWAHPLVDGRPVPKEDVRRCRDTMLAVPIPPGTHTLEVRYQIPLLWRALWVLAWVALAVLAVLSVL